MLNSVKLDTMNQRNSTLEEQYLFEEGTFLVMKKTFTWIINMISEQIPCEINHQISGNE